MKNIFRMVISLSLSAVFVILFLLGCYLPSYINSDAVVSISSEDDGTITLMSTNVRCLAREDILKKSWFYRARLILEDISSVQPDIIGFQEATFVHYDYLQKVMVGYDCEMAYRDNFLLSEGCPIFWRTDKYEKVDSGAFWLSDTPDVMSKDWGSEHYRICVYVILRELSTGKEFAVFNTHLDHTSDLARINGIAVVLDKISEFGNIPSFLMGDMNAKENSETMKYTRESFEDAKISAGVEENIPTYHNWGNPKKSKRIDYILISKSDADVLEYDVVVNCYDGVYSSDHASIYAKVKLK
ncbi:MAG: endonuclease/exonuclease/phosphatase family protein [Clostridia bacterium]|nr:endonuclease/exonuclease/phosphatase family protein [Clostridia bacterium]